MKLHTQSLSTLAMIALFGTTGCPNNDNNTSENNTSQNNAPDMSQDEATDTIDTTPDEESDEQSAEQTCVVLESSPRTFPLGGDPARVTWTLGCAQPLTADALELTAPRELTMELEIPTEGLCQPAEQGHVCTFSANGLTSPAADADIRAEVFELTYGPQERLITDVRWHDTPGALQAAFSDRAIELGADYATGGIGIVLNTRPKRVTRREEVIKAAYVQKIRDAENKRVVVTSGPLGTATATSQVEIGVEWSDLTGQNLESIRNPDGSTETLWWGYDANAKRFVGAALGFDKEGEESYNVSYDALPSLSEEHAFVTILDARATSVPRPPTAGTEEASGVGVYVMGLNAAGNVTFSYVFAGEDSTSTAFPIGAFFGLEEQTLTSKNVGFVKQQGNLDDFQDNGNDEYFLVWHAAPNDTKDKLSLRLFPSFSAPTPETVTPVTLDTGFEVTHTYVSQSSPGSIVVLAHGDKGERAMYRLSYDDATNKTTSQVQLELPDGVDVRPSSCSEPKKNTPKRDDSWECKDSVLSCDREPGGLCGTTDHFRTLGRWPWNWRELKEARAAEKQQSMVLDWNDDGTLNTVFPLVLEPAPAEYTDGAPIVVTEVEGGQAVALHTASLSGEACANPEDCLVQVADSVLVGPGTDGPTIYIQGKGKPKKLKDEHRKAEANRAFAHFGRRRTKSKRVIAPVTPGTSSVATHVLMDLETTPDDSDTVNSAQITITFNGAPLDPNLTLAAVAPHEVDGTEELVLVLKPLRLAEGQDPALTVVSIGGADIDAALAQPDKVAQVEILGDPLTIPVHPRAFEPGGLSLFASLSRDTPVEPFVATPPQDPNTLTNMLSEEDSKHPVLFYPAPTTGVVVANTLRSGANEQKIGYTNVELVMAYMPEEETMPQKLNHPAPGETQAHFSTSPGYAFLISRRAISANTDVFDVTRKNYAVALSQPSFDASTYETGDFNGDGIEDLYISTDFTTLPADTALTDEDVACAGCVVYFGDGLGGFLESTLDLPSGPVVQWGVDGGIQGLAAGRGSGTKRNTTRVLSRAELQ